MIRMISYVSLQLSSRDSELSYQVTLDPGALSPSKGVQLDLTLLLAPSQATNILVR